MNQISAKNLARNVKKIRKERMLTSVQLSLLLGISQHAVSSIESGKGNPTLKTVDNISNCLKVPVSILLEP